MARPAVWAAGRWRSHLVAWAAIEAIAMVAWLAAASVHIVQWTASGPTRLALTAPAWQLVAWLAAGTVLAVALAPGGRLARLATPLTPALTLWLLAVPFLPWVPDRLPLLLVLAGPLRWVVVAAVVVRVALTSAAVRTRVHAAQGLPRVAVFAISLAFYLLFGLNALRTNGLGGDEPHYLIITESLLRDADLQIENNHQQGDYRSFFRGELRPDFMQRGSNGEIYSIHAPGLPAVVAPVYALAGHRGVVAFICLMAALAALAVYDLAAFVATREAAVLTWLAVCFTVPFVPHSWSLFPEMPGALLVAWGALWLWRHDEDAGPARWALRGAVLALLPWLHTKFIVFLACFSVGFGLRLLRRPGRLLAVGTPIAIGCALWLYSFYAVYGSWNPEAPYGAYTRIYVLTRYIPHGLVGLFFDQKFGLLVYSPAYLLAAAGAWMAVRRREWWLPGGILLAAAGAFVVSTARLYMFWGGSSAPARFFVPVLPCLAPFLAMALARVTGAGARAFTGLALAAGLLVALAGVWDPAALMLYSNPHGRARVLELLQAGSPLSLVVPTFTEPSWATETGALARWLAAAALAGAAMLLAGRRPGASAWRAALVGCLVFLVGGSALTARPAAAVREETARRGALDVLWRFDGDRFRPLDYSTLARPDLERFRALTTVRLRPDGGREGEVLELGPLQLPPGLFDAEVWFSSARPREGSVALVEPRAVFGQRDGPLENPATFPVDIPAATRRAVVRVGDAQVAAAVSDVRLVPRAVVPPAKRDPRPARLIESVPGRPGSYLVYTDGDSYPEMGTFWTRGTGRTTVLVAPGGASRLVLSLSTGPLASRVSLSVDGQSQTIVTAPDTPRQVAFDLPPGARLVPVTVASSTMFRPSEVNPGSGDSRGLGCQVHVALE